MISPEDDLITEGDETLEVRGASRVPDLEVQSAYVTITDDDPAGVTITPTDLTIQEGESLDYTVVLDTQPLGEVTIDITVPEDTDVSVDPVSLTFTSANWNKPQTVTVTTEQADAADENEITLSHAVDGTGYQDVDDIDVTVHVTDDESAGLVLSGSVLSVGEGDAGESYGVSLSHVPSVEVNGVGVWSCGVGCEVEWCGRR